MLGPTKVGPLVLRWRITPKTPSLVERTLEVTAEAAQRYAITFPLDLGVDGEFASFSGPLKVRTLCDTVRGTPKTETFPVAMVRTAGRVFGIVADSPGLWENRCEVLVDPPGRRLAVLTGDGREPYPLVVKPPEDARDTYQYQMDGWQSLAAGETRRFTTWVFASPARNHYDAQVAAHLAVANAKGWNTSVVEAILRNTSLYLLRRNLARDADDRPRDGRYIFISGPGYGWKQWVSDGFYTALGLDDPEKTVEAQRAVFWTRMDYEDNAQYYLIWSALVKRAGGPVNEPLVRRAYEFLRRHEKDGYYIPPSLPGSPNPKGWKTYHDVLLYDDGDCPTSDQGFQCGALLAAKELGLPVTDEDVDRAIAAYRSLYNAERGFMPTSRMQRDTLGQDTLYGATLTYAVFGRKLLTDEQVLTHYRTSEKVKSPYGLRVISTADGSLLPGHSGRLLLRRLVVPQRRRQLPLGRRPRPARRRGRRQARRADRPRGHPRPGVQRIDQHGDGRALRPRVVLVEFGLLVAAQGDPPPPRPDRPGPGGRGRQRPARRRPRPRRPTTGPTQA